MLVFEANTAEEFRREVVDYIEGLLSIEEIHLCHRATTKRDQHDTEARRNFLILLSENLKQAAVHRKEEVKQ